VKETLFRFVLRESETVEFRRGDGRVASSQRRHHLGGGVSWHQHRAHRRQRLRTADNWAALAAACVIAWNGWRLLRPAFNELMDRAPDRELIEQIRAVAATIPGVDGVEKCFVRKMGYQFFVDMHVEVDPQMTVENPTASATR
jgi:divalent metal cation (Fe/Co/Zn/Cd) transporter